MTHGFRPKLSIPKLLAVSALGLVAGCPSDDQGDDTGNDSGPSMTTTTSEGSTSAATVAEGSTSTAAATGETTAADSTSSGAIETDTDIDLLPDCQANADQTTCEETLSCQWLPELGGCIIDCTIISDEVTCMEQVGCAWYGDFCDIEPIA